MLSSEARAVAARALSSPPRDFTDPALRAVDPREMFAVVKHGRAGTAMKPFTYTTAQGLAGNYVTTIAEGPDGAIWVGTSRGLCKVSKGSFRDGFVNYTATPRRTGSTATSSSRWCSTRSARRGSEGSGARSTSRVDWIDRPGT